MSGFSRAARLAASVSLLLASAVLAQEVPAAVELQPAALPEALDAADAGFEHATADHSHTAVPAPTKPHEHTTVVTASRPFTSASSFAVRDRDFMIRPHPRPADILQVVPGLYVNQHAGGGKANQYFLRGFDADHGTDVALSVDGVPVNMVSHGHGQGYADLNWIIPELIERVEVFKGPYFAQHGDLATAGAINLTTRSQADQSSLTLSGGSFNTFRGLVIAAPQVEGWSPIIAAQIGGTNGPFLNPEKLERYSLFSKITHPLSEHVTFSLALTAYGSGWNASGQLPTREISAGRLDRFGTVDATDGGNSQRQSLYATLRALTSDNGELNVMAYAVLYRMTLYSNFTFFSANPIDGDQIEQHDDRFLAGARASYRFVRRAGPLTFDTTFGTQLRVDDIHNSLRRTKARRELSTSVLADIREGSLGVFLQEEISFGQWARLILGARGDYFGFDVNDRLDASNSGVAQAQKISPKASLVVSVVPQTDLYVNFGYGFHSNDARGVTRESDTATPLAQALGGEFGVRTRLFDRVDLAASAFLLDLQSELVWVGDDGSTEGRGPTRRMGLEAEARVKILKWLTADLDFTWSKATYVQNAGNGNAVALAPTLIIAGGLSARHPSGPYGRLGALHLADRPATEDGFLVAKGFTRVDAAVGFHHKHFDIALGVQNLLNTQWSEAQFANVSRLPHETSAASCPAGTRASEEGGAFNGCEDLHVTPGAPINFELTASVYF
jgi:outer membrane receptor protein involved in Fe transport